MKCPDGHQNVLMKATQHGAIPTATWTNTMSSSCLCTQNRLYLLTHLIKLTHYCRYSLFIYRLCDLSWIPPPPHTSVHQHEKGEISHSFILFFYMAVVWNNKMRAVADVNLLCKRHWSGLVPISCRVRISRAAHWVHAGTKQWYRAHGLSSSIRWPWRASRL